MAGRVGLTELDNDVLQLIGLYGVTTNVANAYSVNLPVAPTTLVESMTVAVKINVANTGAATLNINGLGAKPIIKPNGIALAAGNLKVGSIYRLQYNGTSFILQGEGGEYGDVTADKVLSGTTFGTETGLKTGTYTRQPAGQQVFDAVGVHTFVVPAGVHVINATVIGGGGGGAGGHYSGSATNSGGGGGGGGINIQAVSVLPGQTISLTVGAGGAQGQGFSQSNAQAASLGKVGGTSNFGSTYAYGGGGGGREAYTNNYEAYYAGTAGQGGGLGVNGNPGGRGVSSSEAWDNYRLGGGNGGSSFGKYGAGGNGGTSQPSWGETGRSGAVILSW